MKTLGMALISVMSALAVDIAYGKGLAIPFLPGLIEFTTIIVFINGFCFGCVIGGTIGALAMAIKMIIPHPFATQRRGYISIILT